MHRNGSTTRTWQTGSRRFCSPPTRWCSKRAVTPGPPHQLERVCACDGSPRGHVRLIASSLIKTDKRDALVLAGCWLPTLFHPSGFPSAGTRTTALVHHRRKLVEQRSAASLNCVRCSIVTTSLRQSMASRRHHRQVWRRCQCLPMSVSSPANSWPCWITGNSDY